MYTGHIYETYMLYMLYLYTYIISYIIWNWRYVLDTCMWKLCFYWMCCIPKLSSVTKCALANKSSLNFKILDSEWHTCLARVLINLSVASTPSSSSGEISWCRCKWERWSKCKLKQLKLESMTRKITGKKVLRIPQNIWILLMSNWYYLALKYIKTVA